MNEIILSLFILALFSIGVALSILILHNFLFSKNSFLKRKKVVKRVNNLISGVENGNYEFVDIDGKTYFFSKQHNKIYDI